MKTYLLRIGSKIFNYWYDRSTRCWWAAEYATSGDQVGDAMHAYTKHEIVRACERAAA